jgi:hypothetical protein
LVIFDLPLPLHLAASALTYDFEQAPGYRYHVHGIAADNFLEKDFMFKVADKIDEHLLIEGVFSTFQMHTLGGYGAGGQLNRNASLNSFPWRNLVINIDFWLFFDDGKKYDMVRGRIEAFREITADTYFKDDGESEMALWLMTDTNIAEDAVLSKLWSHYYPSYEFYLELHSVKLEYDPRNLFSSDMTIPPGPTLATCVKFAVHAQTTVTFDGVCTTIHGGDVGLSPGTSITGGPKFEDGREVKDDSADFATRVLHAHAAAMQVLSKPMDIEIGGNTITTITYHSDSKINFAFGPPVTLDGEGNYDSMFIFQAGTTLVTAADIYFILINGAKAENIIWALGTATTLGARSVVEGSILAGTAITFGTKSELHGCALAQSSVTFESEGSIVLNNYKYDLRKLYVK